MPPDAPLVPEEALSEKFLAATGPGGQNVNKVATAVQLRLDVYALRLAPDVYVRLKALAGSRWTADGEIVIAARRFRTREANRDDARRRLADMVAAAHGRPQPPLKTNPSKAAHVRRVETKAQRGEVKKGRGKVRLD